MPYDNICKYLAEKYPEPFVSWILSEQPRNIRVLKTELSNEPIRADSLILLEINQKILHIEFQTVPKSNSPIPSRMLQYYARLRGKYKTKKIEQVVIFLKETTSEAVFIDSYRSESTLHRYRVIRLWEENPASLLANPTLLPLATLAKSDSPDGLLRQISNSVDTIEDITQQREILACTGVLAGLRFPENMIKQLFREDIMRESVIYQRILQEGREKGREEGRQEGLEEGREEEGIKLLILQLNRRFGKLDTSMLEKLQQLSLSQVEELGQLMLDFSSVEDLNTWFREKNI